MVCLSVFVMLYTDSFIHVSSKIYVQHTHVNKCTYGKWRDVVIAHMYVHGSSPTLNPANAHL